MIMVSQIAPRSSLFRKSAVWYKPGLRTALHWSSLLWSGCDMAVVDSSALRFELKKAPKNGMVGAAFSALLDFEVGDLRVELDRSRKEQGEVGMRRDRYPKGEIILRRS